jgi:hypothetical protein
MKNILTLISLIALALFLFIFLQKRGTGGSSALHPSRDFKVSNAESIARIFIAHRNGETVDLVKKKGEWYIDDSVLVQKGIIPGILDVAKNLEIKYEPNEAMSKTALKTIADNGILIEYFDEQGKKLKSYMMGAAADGGYGNYAIVEGESKPMVVKLRNAPTNLRMHFWKDRRHTWYDQTFIAFQHQDIMGVTLEYTFRADESFKLSRKSNTEFDLQPLNPTVARINKPLNSKIVDSYLINFESVGAESILGYDFSKADSILSLTPWCTLQVEDAKGRVKRYQFFPYLTENEKNFIALKEIKQEDLVHYYVADESGFFYVAQMGVFEKLLWGYTAFFNASSLNL